MKKLAYSTWLLLSAASPAIAQTTSFKAAVPAGQSTVSPSQTVPPLDQSTAPADQAPKDQAISSATAEATGDIIVTAQKRSERLRDVPISITAASGDQLAKQGITSTADLEKVVPGFTYRQSQYGTPVFSIRGIGFYDEQIAVAPTVTVYTNQIPLPYARMSEGAALDVERVEVLKGPQGTLFGQNSTGGAVNYIPARPTDTPQAGFDVTYARFNEADVGGFISGPITSNLTARLSVRSENRGNWQQNITRNADNGQRDFLVGRLLIEWKPTDRLKIELNANGWRDRSDLQISQARGYLPVGSNPPTTPATIATANALRSYPYVTSNNNRLSDWDPGLTRARHDGFYQFAGRVDYDVTDAVQLISISSYAHLQARATVDPDATRVFASLIPIAGSIKAFSQELRLEGQLGTRLKWVIGGNYENDRTAEINHTMVNGSNAEIGGIHFQDLDLVNNQRIRDIAGFGSIDFKLTDKLSLQGSVRYTDEHRAFSGGMKDPGTPLGFRIALGFLGIGPGDFITLGPDGKPGVYNTSLNQTNVSWRGSINWKITPNTLVYANVTKGFKAGSFGTIPAVSYRQLLPATQESVIAYEAGVKTSLFNHTVDFTAAGFYYDYKNKQIQGYVSVQPFGNLPNLLNIPKSRLIGAEAEISARPTNRIRLTAGGTYIDSQVQGDTFLASFFGNTVNARGQAFPATPKYQVQGDVEYNFPIGRAKSVFLGANGSYRSGTVAGFGVSSGPPGTQDYFKINSYALLDLRAGIDIGHKYRLEAVRA